MLQFDVRNYDDATREKLAARVQIATDFKLPALDYWNYGFCRKHRGGWDEQYWDAEAEVERTRRIVTRPAPGCRDCGIHFRKHQRVSVMWLYLKKRALLADTMGSGKTTSAAGLVAMLKQTGELSLSRIQGGRGGQGRVVIVPRAPALFQWQRELNRMIPGVNVLVASGAPDKRARLYLEPWEVLLIGPEMANKDIDTLMRFDLSALITDDIDAMRNRDNTTAKTLKKLGRHADRMTIMTGTPLQKKLKELHSVLDPIGGLQVFGPEDAFLLSYEQVQTVTEYEHGIAVGRKQMTTYKNLDDLKRKMRPMVLRRTARDLDDVTLPEINVTDHFLELYPRQRAKYEELRRGVIAILKETGTETKHLTALSKLSYGAQICTGLAALGEEDGPRTSVKMDWLLDKVSDGGDLGDEKVVIFAQHKNTIRALHRRFEDAGIGYATVWGEEPSKVARQAAQDRFWDDPRCRILIGTQAIEQSLNLQVARHLINVDQILNPARMAQLAGRIRRDGSAFKHVFVHNLFTLGTQEERYLPLLEREAALASFVWDESSELFNALSPLMMLQLITG